MRQTLLLDVEGSMLMPMIITSTPSRITGVHNLYICKNYGCKLSRAFFSSVISSLRIVFFPDFFNNRQFYLFQFLGYHVTLYIYKRDAGYLRVMPGLKYLCLSSYAIWSWPLNRICCFGLSGHNLQVGSGWSEPQLVSDNSLTPIYYFPSNCTIPVLGNLVL